MTQNIEQRTLAAVNQYENASGTIDKFAHADEVLNIPTGAVKTFPKISKEWDENSKALTADWKAERDALSIKALPVLAWVNGETETNINQQRRFTDGHTYLPKTVPAAMNAEPDANWIAFTADKSNVLSDVFGSKPVDLVNDMTLTPTNNQYPKLAAFGAIYELADDSVAYTVKSFAQSVGGDCVITLSDDTQLIAHKVESASRRNVRKIISLEGVVNLRSIADLRALNDDAEVVFVKAYYSDNSLGGGIFYSINEDIEDDSGIHIKNANGVTYKRQCKTVSPSDFGAKADGKIYDSQVQACVDNTVYPIEFDSDFTVRNIKYRTYNLNLNQAGYLLIAAPIVVGEVLPDQVLDITCRSSNLKSVAVNANFMKYNQVIRWHSLSPTDPANNTTIQGIKPLNCINGLVYGNRWSEPVVDSPHSENVMYDFESRGCKFPFIANQPNGFLTAYNPIFDCNPYEYINQPNFPSLNWDSESQAFANHVNNCLTIIGGEILKTTSQEGYGWTGGNVTQIGVTNEIGCVRALITGDVQITNERGGYQSSDNKELYHCEDGVTATVTIDNGQCHRADGVSEYSGINLIKNNTTNSVRFVIKNSNYTEWKSGRIGTTNIDMENVTFKWKESNTDKMQIFGCNWSQQYTPDLLRGWVVDSYLAVTKTPDGEISIKGAIKGGTTGAAFKVDPPAYPIDFPIVVGEGFTRKISYIMIDIDGSVYVHDASDKINLSSISYFVQTK